MVNSKKKGWLFGVYLFLLRSFSEFENSRNPLVIILSEMKKEDLIKIKHTILSYLDDASIGRLTLVAKPFKTIMQDQVFWKNHCIWRFGTQGLCHKK